jgi:phytoene synthase
VREDAQRGRCYLPADEMEAHNVQFEDLLSGEEHEGVKALLEQQAERAKSYYARAFSELPEQDRYAQLSGLVMAEIYQTLLQRIEALDYPVLRQRVALPTWRKLWLAWRCARREKKRANAYRRQHAAAS